MAHLWAFDNIRSKSSFAVDKADLGIFLILPGVEEEINWLPSSVIYLLEDF